MKKLLTLTFLLPHLISFGQSAKTQPGKIEFYLTKRHIVNMDTTLRVGELIKVTMADLEDTAFIKDNEIISYSTHMDTLEDKSRNIHYDSRHIFRVSPFVTNRINNLKLPEEFALVANNRIIYTGVFWPVFSSVGSAWITALATGNSIEIFRKLPDNDFTANSADPRRNPLLFDCLKQTHRFRNP